MATTKTPYPYQSVGAEWLADRHRALLADEMGLGKTPQAALAAEAVGAQRVLVICPASLLVNWRREFEAFVAQMPAQLEIVSYDKARDEAVFNRLYSQCWDVLIVDEAHYCKTRDSLRTIAVMNLVSRAHRVWFLTGTPMPNNPSELYPLIRAIDPGLIPHPKSGKPLGYWDFAKKYCHIVDNGWGQQIRGGRNLDELSRLLDRVMLRRRANEVLDLPPFMVGDVFVEAKLTRELRDLEDELGPAVTAALERYEAGDDKALAGISTHVAKLRRLIGTVKAPAVAKLAADRLEGNEGQPLIIFAWHTDVVDIIKETLTKGGFKVATIVGSDSQGARQRAVDDFQAGKLDVVIGNIQAAGVGITLTRSNFELFAESSWVPADNWQAMKRAHRIGQTRPVTAQFAILAGSIDEAIQGANARKARDFGALFNKETGE